MRLHARRFSANYPADVTERGLAHMRGEFDFLDTCRSGEHPPKGKIIYWMWARLPLTFRKRKVLTSGRSLGIFALLHLPNPR